MVLSQISLCSDNMIISEYSVCYFFFFFSVLFFLSFLFFFFFLILFFFFFQAEDGIRDLVRSRGLGDVYKRQVHGLRFLRAFDQDIIGIIGSRGLRGQFEARHDLEPVSYTHLTLPTSDLV